MTTELKLKWQKSGQHEITTKDGLVFMIIKTNYGFYVLRIINENGKMIEENWDTKKEAKQMVNQILNATWKKELFK